MVKRGGLCDSQLVVIAVVRGGRKGVDCRRSSLGGFRPSIGGIRCPLGSVVVADRVRGLLGSVAAILSALFVVI